MASPIANALKQIYGSNPEPKFVVPEPEIAPDYSALNTNEATKPYYQAQKRAMESATLANQMASDPNTMSETLKLVLKDAGYTPEEPSWGVQHPYLNAVATVGLGGAFGGLAGAILGESPSDVLAGLAIGGALGMTEMGRAKEEWKKGNQDYNKEIAKMIFPEYMKMPERIGKTASDLATTTKTASDINQILTESVMRDRALEKAGLGYITDGLGLIGKDSFADIGKLKGNADILRLNDRVDQYITEKEPYWFGKSFDDYAKQTGRYTVPIVKDTKTEQYSEQQKQAIANRYRDSFLDIGGNEGYKNLTRAILDPEIPEEQKLDLKKKFVEHNKVHDLAVKAGVKESVLDSLKPKTIEPSEIIKQAFGGYPELSFAPSEQVSTIMGRIPSTMSGATEAGAKAGLVERQAQRQQRNDEKKFGLDEKKFGFEKEKEKNREQRFQDTLDLKRDALKVNWYRAYLSKIKLDKYLEDQKYKDGYKDYTQRMAMLEAYGNLSADKADLIARYFTILEGNDPKLPPEEAPYWKERVREKTGKYPEEFAKFFIKPDKSGSSFSLSGAIPKNPNSKKN